MNKKLLRRLSGKPGQTVSAKDFLHLGPRAAVDQAFSRLVRKGALRRIGRGLYEFPRMGTLFNKPIPQSPDALITAWARKNRLKVLPSEAYAANLLGFSTQVPAQIVYYTNGQNRTLMLEGLTMRLFNRGPKTMGMRDGVSARTVQALRNIGKKNVSDEDIARVRKLFRPKDRAAWTFNSRLAPSWIRDILAAMIYGKGRNR